MDSHSLYTTAPLYYSTTQFRARVWCMLWLSLCAGTLPAQVRQDVFIHLSGGDSLDATYFTPALLPPAGAPAILFVHGFGLDKTADTANCRVYAASGYVTLCFSVRGHGNSSGRSTIMSLRERADLVEVLAFLRAFPEVDTAHVGIAGGSQGGLHGLWAVADGLPVQAVSSDVIVPHWADDMLMNGSVRRTVLLLLQAPSVRYAAARDSLWNLLRGDDYDAFRTMFAEPRDLDTALLNSATVPTLRLLKWQDHYFSATDGITAFDRYAGPKKMYIGSRGHFSDHVESERVYQYDQVTRWLGHFLKGADNGITDEPLYTYAVSSLPMDSLGYFTWTRQGVEGWPPPGIQNYRLYLSSDSSLRYTPPAVSLDSLYLENLYADSSYTFDDGFIEGFRGDFFASKLPRRALVFQSPPLPSDVTWIGSPAMKLYVRSSTDKFPLHAQIYEVDSLGVRYFVNRINFTGRHRTPGAADSVVADGIPHAHRFSAGSRIRIELTNIDVTNRIDLGSYPFVVPMFANAGVSIRMDAGRPSYVELPLAGSPTDVQGAAAEEPSAFRVRQNYPNPFNSSTIITFSVGAQSFVKLEVYDLLGQQVATLVHKELAPGEYRAAWHADAHPSGVYFFRLDAGRVQKTEKMLLLR